MIHGCGKQVDALLTHADVRTASFVGSAPVAKAVYAKAAAAAPT